MDTRLNKKREEGIMDTKPVIYLTGFGPFGPHTINSSQMVVELVAKSNIAEDLGVNLVTEILEVNYQKTKSIVPQQLDALKPQVVIHVGVSGQAKHLVLELQASNSGYCIKDNEQCTPDKNKCIQGSNEDIKCSKLPLSAICDKLNSEEPRLQLQSQTSNNAGLYLCSFVYYLSLHRDCHRAVFVHVPPIEESPVENTAATLNKAIRLIYDAVSKADQLTNGISCGDTEKIAVVKSPQTNKGDDHREGDSDTNSIISDPTTDRAETNNNGTREDKTDTHSTNSAQEYIENNSSAKSQTCKLENGVCSLEDEINDLNV